MILMKNKLLISVLIVLVCIFSTSCSKNTNVNNSQNEFTMIQADGSKLILDKKPKRVVVLFLATATILDALDIDIVGMVSTRREISENLVKLPKVGSPIKPNIEKILQINPDLVITSDTFYNVQNEMFVKNKINALYIKNITYEDTKNSIKYFGEYFDRESKAEELLRQMEIEEIKIVNNKEIHHYSEKIIILHATNKEIQMASKNSFVGSIASKFDVVNIADSIDVNKSQTYIALSLEHIAKENPDKIIVTTHSRNKNLVQSIEDEFKEDRLWQSTNAVKNKAMFYLDEELFYANPGIKCTDALKYFAEIFYE